MILNIDTYLHYYLSHPTDLILQIEAAATSEQTILSADIRLSQTDHFSRVPAESEIGDRLVMLATDNFSCRYIASIEIEREEDDLSQLKATPVHKMPGRVLRYLMPSGYCPFNRFHNIVEAEFGHLQGGAQIIAMREWVHKNIRYISGVSGTQTTAMDTYINRQGVCRDFAHLLITFARAAGIPARFASVYAPDVWPQDFHAVAEVYLSDAWHMIDATGMSNPIHTAIIGVGVDAAETAFLTTYGMASFVEQNVIVNAA